MNTISASGYAFGPFVLNLQRMSLQRDGHDLDLRPKAFDVLRHLVERPGNVVTKDELVAAAWPAVIVGDDALTQCIRDIRKALGDDGEEYIRTVPRRGYLFAADVAVLDSIERQPGHRRGSGMAVLALVAVVAIAAVVWFMSLRSVDVAPPVVASTTPSIAVLPFDDMSGNPELAYFGEGVSNDIIAMLVRVPDLTVLARNSSFTYRGQAVDVRKVGEELGATHVLEGSVRKEADRVRIVAQLVDARTGKHVWAERFDRTGTDPLALQDEVTERIVAALVGYAGMLAREQYRDVWGKDSANLQEYDYVLRAYALNLQTSAEAQHQAVATLKEGLSRFPRSGMLKATLAASYVAWHVRGGSDGREPAEIFREAGELAREALADPAASPLTRRMGHLALAYANLTEGRHDQALMDAEAVIALAPYDGSVVHHLGEIPIGVGRPLLALEWVERAVPRYPEGDPRLPGLLAVKAWALGREGRFEEAVDALSDMRGMLPSMYIMRANYLSRLGRLDEAKADIDTLHELEPGWTQATFRRRFYYVDPEIVEDSVRVLAAAGLPEN